MATLPAPLRDPRIRFFCLPGRQKDAKRGDKGIPWKNSKREQLAHDAPVLTKHLGGGENYGVICCGTISGGLVAVDADVCEIGLVVEKDLPPTFTVRTGRSSGAGRHYYFWSPGWTDQPSLYVGGKEAGTLKALGYVVGPGSTHPDTGRPYLVERDMPIATVTLTDLRRVLTPFLEPDAEESRKEEVAAFRREGEDIGALPIEGVVNTSGLHKTETGYQGPHPVHGSETGQNFSVDTAKGVWHCFRHGTGGGPASWIAVVEGILECKDAKPGRLKGKAFLRTLAVAEKRYGLKRRAKTGEQVLSETEVAVHAEEAIHALSPGFAAPRDTQVLYMWRDGRYIEASPYVAAALEPLRWEAKNGDIKRYHTSQIEEWCNRIARQNYHDREEFDSDPQFLPCKNGVIDLLTGALLPPDPKRLAFASLPWDYRPEATCPAITAALSQWVAAPPPLIEFAAYALWRGTPLHTALMLVGEGANGKSTWLDILCALFGDNAGAVSLQDLENNRFAAARLRGKMINVYADLSPTALTKSGMFKALTAGDPIGAEEKGRPGFTYRAYAKHAFSANRLPAVNDDTYAFWRRWVLITFPHQFMADPSIKSKLQKPSEIEGLLALLVRTLPGVLERRKIAGGDDVEATRAIYLRSSDPVKAWCESALVQSPEGWLPKDDLYNAFKAWAIEARVPIPAEDGFKRRLKQTLVPFKDERRGGAGARVYGVVGWAFISPESPAVSDESERPVRLENFAVPPPMGDNGGLAQPVGEHAAGPVRLQTVMATYPGGAVDEQTLIERAAGNLYPQSKALVDIAKLKESGQITILPDGKLRWAG